MVGYVQETRKKNARKTIDILLEQFQQQFHPNTPDLLPTFLSPSQMRVEIRIRLLSAQIPNYRRLAEAFGRHVSWTV